MRKVRRDLRREVGGGGYLVREIRDGGFFGGRGKVGGRLSGGLGRCGGTWGWREVEGLPGR